MAVTFVFVSVFSLFPQSVNAQVAGGVGASGQAGGGFSLEGVAGLALQCAGGVGAISNAVGKLRNLLGNRIISTATNVGQVPVTDATAQTKIDNATTEVQTNNVKEQCLDAIARYAVLKVIDKITLMTVEWINSGFDGNPFYPEDRPNFFEQIAQDEVINFTGWFSANPEDFPFGAVISEAILMSVQGRLDQNLRYSLNQVLQHQNQYATAVSFNANFSVGGWAGYAALIQPNNNIFGNYLVANQYLARRTAGTNITVAGNFQRQLDEASGLLNQRECARTAFSDSYYVTGDEYIDPTHPLHLGNYPLIPEGQTMPQGVYESLPLSVREYLDAESGTDDMAVVYNVIVKRSTCLQWRTVTPGRFLADQTTQILGSPLRNLELGDELNENLGLIFDALAAQLFRKVGGGIRSLYSSEGDYSSDPNASNYNAVWAQVNNSNHGQTYNQPPVAEVINGNTVDTGIIEIQQQFLIEALSTRVAIENLVRDIRTLDYCVPGPNPRWVEEAGASLQNIISGVATFSDDTNYYPSKIQELLGFSVNSIQNYSDFVGFVNYALTKYSEAMISRYSLSQGPPSIRPVATNLYLQIDNLQTQSDILQEQISGITSVMPQLQLIASQLASLTPEQQADTNSTEMQTITSLLNQISGQGVLVNQSILNQVSQNRQTYNAQIFATENYIEQCIADNTSPANARERVAYPFPSISQNPQYGNIPAPNNGFLNGVSFGGNGSAIDLSGYNNLNLNIPNTSTQTFANSLQSVF